MPEQSRRTFDRREALGMGLKFGAAAGGVMLWEGLRFIDHTKFQFVNEQDRFRKSDKGVMVFGGYSIQDAGPVGRAIAPAFDVPTMYTVYSRNRLDIAGAVDNFLQIQRNTGMRELTIYGHSEGVQVGSVFAHLLKERVGDRVRIPRFIMDCPTVDLSDTKYDLAGEILVDNPIYNGGTLLSMIGNTIYYKNPVQPGTAFGGLAVEEAKMLHDGRTYIEMLAKYVDLEQSQVYALWPLNPAADQEVLDNKSRTDFSHYIPGIRNIRVDGRHQGHANPDHNQHGYLKALSQVNALSGGGW